MSLLIANGYWPLEKSQPIVEKTQTIRLAPDISQLSEGERKAVAKLIEVGQIFRNFTNCNATRKRSLRIAPSSS